MPEFRLDKKPRRFDRKGRYNRDRDSDGESSFESRYSERGERRSFDAKNADERFGRRNFGKKESMGKRETFFSKRTSDKKDLFKVICSKCGVECEVPFKPTNSKPVFCRDCFKKQEEPKKESDFELHKEYTAELQKINEKLNKIMKVLNVN